MLAFLVNPAVIGLAVLLLSIVWMLRDEKDRTRPLLVIALVLNLVYGWVLAFVMGKENGLVPWKYDYVLARFDDALGLNAAHIATALLHAGLRMPLFVVYQLMVPLMVVWFFVARARRQSGAIIVTYVAEMLAGPALYALVPACGPAYAFHAGWLRPPMVEPQVIRLSGNPNAFPSLHIATALAFVLFAPSRWTRIAALAFLAATGLATISAGEHYVIDLAAGLAFGSFAAAIGKRSYVAAGLFGGIALCWSLAVRFAHVFLLGHPGLLQAAAAATMAAVVLNVVMEWRRKSEVTSSTVVYAAG